MEIVYPVDLPRQRFRRLYSVPMMKVGSFAWGITGMDQWATPDNYQGRRPPSDGLREMNAINAGGRLLGTMVIED